ncbi:MAG TPA: metallophosphoesterase [Gemmatimonadaceae bacterium]|nr:metallophosphoesterase [Gemmatimonadaceae bacterium]
MALRLLHVSDLHFGRHSIAEQVDGVRRLIATETFDAIVISGDLSQRTRTWEFKQAADFLTAARKRAPVMVVPGNHDTAWWTAPMGLGSISAMHTRYRKYVSEELEPVLRVPGATIVGLNSAHGLRTFTLTMRPRDLSVVGAVRKEQWERAKREFQAAPAGDLRVLVFHHNLLRGEISNRWGLASRARGITDAARAGAELVLNGHDHQADVERLEVDGKGMVVACASTLTTRVRGGGPGSINLIEVDETTIQVNGLQWSPGEKQFGRVMWARYAR